MEELVQQLIKQNEALMQALKEKSEYKQDKVTVSFEKFDEAVENFDSFIERFEAFLDIQNVPEAKRGKVLISSLNAKLYNLLKNLLAPENPSEKDFSALKKVLKDHLNPKALIIPSRHMFINRKQHEGESINKYIAELRSLAIPCEYKEDMLNTMLRDVFVSGLRDRNILDRLFQEDDIDLDKTIKIALSMEKAVQGANEIIGKSPEIKVFKAGKKEAKSRKPNNVLKRNKNGYCSRCLGNDHNKNNCRFISSECRFCKKIGHIEKACYAAKKTRPVKQKKVETTNDCDSKNEIPIYGFDSRSDILKEEEPKKPPIMIQVKIENKTVSMELDTGGTVSVMSLNKFRQISNKKILPTKIVFKTYRGDKVVPLGYVTVKVEYNSQKLNLNLYIVKENLDTIFGREWLYKINLDWNSIKTLKTSSEINLKKMFEDYKEIFDGKLGEINNYEVKLKLKPNVQPIFCRSRPVPFALKNRVESEIDRLEKEGIIEKIETSDWATPVVPIVKPDGSIRLCADYSVTLNPNLEVPQHPLPKLEEIFSCLSGGKHFSKLDFSHAYLQMKVHPESQKFLTINTHKGLYGCKRLMYGLNAAPAIWQRYVEGLFRGMEGIKIFMDDARVTGPDDQSHLKVLETFFQKCKEHGLKLNLTKSKFFQNEITFLGHKIDAKGLHKTDEKISAIANAPIPNNIQDIKSFLGLVNFYGKFCPNLATIANPLNNLTKKGVKWKWSKECQLAFGKIKAEICSNRVLIHYDPTLPLTLATDASPVGIGAVLSHVLSDGTERPIAFASRTLTATEQKYSQIDKEALSIVWAVKKFYLYLKGRRFTLVTDHKPLVAMFSSKKGLPILTATRLLHYALILQAYQFDIVYRNTKDHGNADCLSRLPLKSEELRIKDDIEMFQLTQLETLPVKARDLAKETRTDEELSILLRKLKFGENLEGREAEYTLQDDCIMHGQRVVIPRKFRARILEELHQGHLGIVKMKAIARSYVYWKGIDHDIEETVKNCSDCIKFKLDPVKAKVHHWEYPSAPWERIHVDFAGPIFERMFLIIVDAHSKWMEVYPLKSTNSFKTIECLGECFSRFGLPLVLVSDNGSQFTSQEFETFMENNGIKHKTCAPFKPSSNGQAERYVYTVKQSLRAMQGYPGNIRQKISTFLMNYRKAPNLTTMQSPAMLFLKREIRTRIDLVVPNLKRRVEEHIRKDTYDFKDRNFDIGDKVAIRDYRAANSRWKIGTVINKDGALHYTVDVQGTLFRRHVDQMRSVGNKVQSASLISRYTDPCVTATPEANAEPQSAAAMDHESRVPSTPSRPEMAEDPRKVEALPVVAPKQDLQQPELRRSKRIRKAPQRLNL